MTGTKGAPVVGDVTVMDTRSVRVKLSNCSRMVVPYTGHVFVPDRLSIQYRQGAAVVVSVSGPRLRHDGGTYLDDRRTGRSYLNTVLPPPYVLDGDTPDWVRELVDRHAPVGALAIP